jgi:hypothetical protein
MTRAKHRTNTASAWRRLAALRDNMRAVQRGICQIIGRNEKSRLKAGFFV